MMGALSRKSTTTNFKDDSISPGRQPEIDIKDQQFSSSANPPMIPKASAKPPKKAPTGNKIYVSSKVVDALVHVKKHTEELGNKRSMLKERL